MKQMVKALFIGAALLVISAQPAAAQSNISGGYALVNWNGCCAHGFDVDFSHQVHSMGNMAMSVVGDFGWTRFSGEETDTTYAGGLRFSFLKETKAPVHAQVLFGGVHWKEDDVFGGFSGDDFIIGFGAGTIIKVHNNIGVKPQVDWFILPGTDGESDWFFRFSINAVIPIGKK